MKKILLLIFILLIVLVAKSQSLFCLPGAEWKYSYVTVSGEYTGSVKHVGDTLLNGEIVQMIKYRSFYKTLSPIGCSNTIFIKQHGDTVFMKNCYTKGTWQILYNFAAAAGQYWLTTVKDSVTTGSYAAVTHTIVVNAVTTITLNGLSLRKMFVSYCYGSGVAQCYNAEIIERVGCITYLFNYANSHPYIPDADAVYKFLCYSDSTFSPTAFSPGGCNYIVGIDEQKSNKGISIYPNPASEELFICLPSASSDEFQIILTDLSGREIKSMSLFYAETHLNIQNLENGLYLLQIQDGLGKPVYQQKLLKQN